jgi:4-amino-4-deoxy-L-arabinose transferase-like glycosyltransferase
LPDPKAQGPKRSGPPLWPWVLAACIPLIGWWSYGLFDLDEGFYAAVVAEMNRRGEWINPL